MNSKKISSVIKGWLFIGFGTLIIVVFCFYPMIGALANSFQTGMGMNLHFCGLANYKRLLVDPIFLSSVKKHISLSDCSGTGHAASGHAVRSSFK